MAYFDYNENDGMYYYDNNNIQYPLNNYQNQNVYYQHNVANNRVIPKNHVSNRWQKFKQNHINNNNNYNNNNNSNYNGFNYYQRNNASRNAFNMLDRSNNSSNNINNSIIIINNNNSQNDDGNDKNNNNNNNMNGYNYNNNNNGNNYKRQNGNNGNSNVRERNKASFVNGMLFDCGVEIISIRNENECQVYIKKLLSSTQNCNIFAIDCEWKPTFRKGHSPNNAAILQISNHKYCLIIYLQKIFLPLKPHYSNALTDFLLNKSLIKIGVGIGDDVIKLEKSFGISVESTVDMSDFIFKKCEFFASIKNLSIEIKEGKREAKNGIARRRVTTKTLDGITYLLTNGINIGKTKSATMSNWENYPLTQRQMEYASRDVIFPFYAFIQAIYNMNNENVLFNYINFNDINSNKNNQNNKVIDDDIIEAICLKYGTKSESFFNKIESIINSQVKIKEQRVKNQEKKDKQAKWKQKVNDKEKDKDKDKEKGDDNGNGNGNGDQKSELKENDSNDIANNSNNNNNNNSDMDNNKIEWLAIDENSFDAMQERTRIALASLMIQSYADNNPQNN